MKLSELIRKNENATVTVATHATDTPIHPPSVATVASVNVAIGTNGKPETIQDRQREARRQKVIAMLEAAPGTRYAVLVTDTSTDPVVVAVGIREIATFEMEIPHKYYDGMALLELIEKQSGEKYANN
jgi:hypothetical protein